MSESTSVTIPVPAAVVKSARWTVGAPGALKRKVHEARVARAEKLVFGPHLVESESD